MTRKKNPRQRISKAQWLECALDVLQKEGIDGVRIERLARILGVAKAGFYWHFANRAELLREMLAYWTDEYTEVVIKASGSGSPRKRLKDAIEIISNYELAKYDLAIRGWAATDTSALAAVRRVYKIRMDYIRSIFSSMGFLGTNLEMRTRMFVCYYSWSPTIFPLGSKSERDRLNRQIVNWFCG